MATTALFGAVVGVLLIMIAGATKKEKWQMAYGLLGLFFIFYSLGFLGFNGVIEKIGPALVLLTGLFSFYTKGTAQLVAMLAFIILFYQVILV